MNFCMSHLTFRFPVHFVHNSSLWNVPRHYGLEKQVWEMMWSGSFSILSSFPGFAPFLGHRECSSFQGVFPSLKAVAFLCTYCRDSFQYYLLLFPLLAIECFFTKNNFFYFLIRYLAFCKLLNYAKTVNNLNFFIFLFPSSGKWFTDIITFTYAIN